MKARKMRIIFRNLAQKALSKSSWLNKAKLRQSKVDAGFHRCSPNIVDSKLEEDAGVSQAALL
jgi:hypothetical protein